MSSPKNWSRNKPSEGTGNIYKMTIYYWEHNHSVDSVRVMRYFLSEDVVDADYPELSGSTYIYDIRGPRGRIGEHYYTNKEFAKDDALEWMRDNPEL
jgi:hypothetical protein